MRKLARPRAHARAVFGLVALGACGGRSVIEVEDRTIVVEADASTVFVVVDAAPPSPDGSVLVLAEAGVEATSDATVEAGVDAGSGICPEPPLLTGNGVPLAPSWMEQLALGNEHTCLLIDGQVWCWGQNHAGELGDGTQVSRARPTRVKGIDTAVVIDSGAAFDIGCYAARGSHTCVVLNDATVKCWGSNVAGENEWMVASFEPITIGGLEGVTKLGVSGYGNCAVLRDGNASCWGVQPKPFPAFDGGLAEIAGGEGLFARRNDGTVWTFGVGTSKAVTTFYPPVKVPTLSSVVSIAAGWGHQCALRNDKTVWCWGFNGYGQLGDGTTTNQWTTPVQVVGLNNAVAIGLGSRVSCAVLSDTTLKCWGDNSHGQLGLGTFGGYHATPIAVPGLDKVAEIHGGWRHVCARRWSDLSVWCWGQNDSGQVGDGTATDRASPVHVFP